MKRIYFDENDKLVIETDNGKIVDGTAEAVIEGTFTISADNVAKLVASPSGVTIASSQTIFTRDFAYHIVTADTELKESLDEYEKGIRDIIRIRDRYRRLILDHNANCGLFHKKIEL